MQARGENGGVAKSPLRKLAEAFGLSFDIWDCFKLGGGLVASGGVLALLWGWFTSLPVLLKVLLGGGTLLVSVPLVGHSMNYFLQGDPPISLNLDLSDMPARDDGETPPLPEQRKLDQDQHHALVNRLRSFAGNKVYIQFFQDDEAANYARDFFAVFVEAEWKGSCTNYWGDLLRFSPTISVWAHDTETAMKFGQIFMDVGIGKVYCQRKSNMPKENYLEILIGPRKEVNLLNKLGS